MFGWSRGKSLVGNEENEKGKHRKAGKDNKGFAVVNF
jgi:hypothetical protein